MLLFFQSKDKLPTSGTKREHSCGSSDEAQVEVTKRVGTRSKKENTRRMYMHKYTIQ